jgi:hypothetical protein
MQFFSIKVLQAQDQKRSNTFSEPGCQVLITHWIVGHILKY